MTIREYRDLFISFPRKCPCKLEAILVVLKTKRLTFGLRSSHTKRLHIRGISFTFLNLPRFAWFVATDCARRPGYRESEAPSFQICQPYFHLIGATLSGSCLSLAARQGSECSHWSLRWSAGRLCPKPRRRRSPARSCHPSSGQNIRRPRSGLRALRLASLSVSLAPFGPTNFPQGDNPWLSAASAVRKWRITSASVANVGNQSERLWLRYMRRSYHRGIREWRKTSRDFFVTLWDGSPG